MLYLTLIKKTLCGTHHSYFHNYYRGSEIAKPQLEAPEGSSVTFTAVLGNMDRWSIVIVIVSQN